MSAISRCGAATVAFAATAACVVGSGGPGRIIVCDPTIGSRNVEARQWVGAKADPAISRLTPANYYEGLGASCDPPNGRTAVLTADGRPLLVDLHGKTEPSEQTVYPLFR